MNFAWFQVTTQSSSPAIVIPATIIFQIIATGVIALIAAWIKQAIGRFQDSVTTLQREVSEHKIECDKINKEVLLNRVVTAERDVERLRESFRTQTDVLTTIATHLKMMTLPPPPSIKPE